MAAISHDSSRYPFDVADRRKTSFVVDFEKVNAVKEVLGTKTLTETVDAALAEILNIQKRARLVELLFGDDHRLDLDDPDVMAGAWR